MRNDQGSKQAMRGAQQAEMFGQSRRKGMSSLLASLAPSMRGGGVGKKGARLASCSPAAPFLGASAGAAQLLGGSAASFMSETTF